jgi:hypothetical protein
VRLQETLSPKLDFRLTAFSKKFVPSTVRRVPRGIAQTSAELFCPLLCPLPRRAYLRLFDALFAVGTVPEFHELLAGLGVQDGLHRFFDGLPRRSDRRLAWRIRTSLAISATL